ncbi:MAG: DUF6290 family protein [Caldiserica bacterium]|nr:DUF6290 family protein [Caldisericota bacterium]
MRKKPRGRPLKRTTYVMVRLSPKEKRIWKELALMERMSLSEFLRQLITERAKAQEIWK